MLWKNKQNEIKNYNQQLRNDTNLNNFLFYKKGNNKTQLTKVVVISFYLFIVYFLSKITNKHLRTHMMRFQRGGCVEVGQTTNTCWFLNFVFVWCFCKHFIKVVVFVSDSKKQQRDSAYIFFVCFQNKENITTGQEKNCYEYCLLLYNIYLKKKNRKS